MATKKKKSALQKFDWFTAVYRLAVVGELAAIIYFIINMLRGEVYIYKMLYAVLNASPLH